MCLLLFFSLQQLHHRHRKKKEVENSVDIVIKNGGVTIGFCTNQHQKFNEYMFVYRSINLKKEDVVNPSPLALHIRCHNKVNFTFFSNNSES